MQRKKVKEIIMTTNDVLYIAIGNEEMAGCPDVREGDMVTFERDGKTYTLPVSFGTNSITGEKTNLICAVTIPGGPSMLVGLSGKLLGGYTLIKSKHGKR